MRLLAEEERHMQMPKAAVAGGEQGAAKQCRTHAVTLPRLLDADRGLGLARKTRAERTQLRRATHCIADEEAMHDRIQAGRQIDIFANEVIRDATGKPVAPALRVKTKQMLAVFGRFSDPQFADYAAFGKDFLHWVS